MGPTRIPVHVGKMKIYKCIGERSEVCDHLERIARTVLEEAECGEEAPFERLNAA